MSGAGVPWSGDDPAETAPGVGDAASLWLLEPRRVDPALAVVVRRCIAADGHHLPDISEQLASCLRAVDGMGGGPGTASPAASAGPLVFEVACGGDPRLGSEALLTAALGLRLFDGVVVSELGVLQVDEYPLFHFRASMLLGSCELYVADRPDVTLWGPQAVGFEPMVAAATDPVRCAVDFGRAADAGPGPAGRGSAAWADRGDEVCVGVEEVCLDPLVLLRHPVWPRVAGGDVAGLWSATLARRAAVDVFDADLERAEDAVLAAARGRQREDALAGLGVVSVRYQRVRLELLVLQSLAAGLFAD